MPAGGEIDHDIADESRPRRGRGLDSRARERALARLLDRQHGVAARRQLFALGYGRGAIAHRVDCSRLQVVHRGVYSLGSPARLGPRGRWLAATLACGDGAVLSHRSAAALWGLLPAGLPIHVTVPGRRGSGASGIALHRPRELAFADCAERGGIPVTTLPRTLVDLAAVADQGTIARAVEEADRLQLLEIGALVAVRRRLAGRRGVRRLDRVLIQLHPSEPTRSELERRFASLCRRERLPAPSVNALAGGFEVDFLWPRQQLVVELDGYAFHRSRGAFERDRVRDAVLAVAGYRILRITAARLDREPDAVAAAIRALLSGRPG